MIHFSEQFLQTDEGLHTNEMNDTNSNKKKKTQQQQWKKLQQYQRFNKKENKRFNIGNELSMRVHFLFKGNNLNLINWLELYFYCSKDLI